MPLNHHVIPCTCLFDWSTRLNINSYRKRLATLCSSSAHVLVFAISRSIFQKPSFPLSLILIAGSSEPLWPLNEHVLNRHMKPNLQGRAIFTSLIKEVWQELTLLFTCRKVSRPHFTRPLVPIWVKWSVFWGRDTMFGQEAGGGLKACGQDRSDREAGGGGLKARNESENESRQSARARVGRWEPLNPFPVPPLPALAFSALGFKMEGDRLWARASCGEG